MLAHWPDEAGRAAYLAGLHAAHALIVESTGKTVKPLASAGLPPVVITGLDR
jgi:hypothetical protein